ncbi:MAG: hypothetical protein WD733_14305 [Bryobacterales bacterium]
MGKALDPKTLIQSLLQLGQMASGDYQIQVKADQRLNIGINSLPAHDAKTDLMIPQKGHEMVEKVGFIRHHRFPETQGLH